MENQYFSKEGLEKLKKELEDRLTVTRPEIAARIKEAKELGDLSESAEYESAKEAQSANEGRIEEIKNILENAVVVTGSSGSSIAGVGSCVKAESKHGVQEFVIVGASESNPGEGFISNESPLGKLFLGRKKGESIELKTPKGTVVSYKILEIK